MSKLEDSSMQIILHAGNARALAYEALAQVKGKNYMEAARKLEEAEQELELAHEVQTALLQSEAAGVGQAATLLVSHALDHLMNAASEKGLIAEIIELYKRVAP